MYPENNRKVLLFSQATRNVDTGATVVVSISYYTSINSKIYFKKRQSSEPVSLVKPLRVSSSLVELVLGTALRNGVLGARQPQPENTWMVACSLVEPPACTKEAKAL